MGDYKLILDIIVSLLLAATIAYAVLLNRRLETLRRNRDELARMIGQFNEATMRAESSIPKLRKAADDAGGGLQDRVEKAQLLRDDLAFMIERADSMANKLEIAVRQARSESKPAPRGPRPLAAMAGAAAAPGPAPVAVPETGAMDELDERSDAERELLRALQSVR